MLWMPWKDKGLQHVSSVYRGFFNLLMEDLGKERGKEECRDNDTDRETKGMRKKGIIKKKVRTRNRKYHLSFNNQVSSL